MSFGRRFRDLRLLAASAATTACILVSAGSARADSLTADEAARLARRETVVRQQTVERGDHRYVGGVTYTIVDASKAEVAAIFEDVDALRRVLPRTKSARVVGESRGDTLLELVQGNAVVEAQYTLRVRREADEARFWLEPSLPHGIDDAWGFFRYEPFITKTGEPRVLMTFGVLVDVGSGLLRDLVETKVRAALQAVPQRVRREVASLHRGVHRPETQLHPVETTEGAVALSRSADPVSR